MLVTVTVLMAGTTSVVVLYVTPDILASVGAVNGCPEVLVTVRVIVAPGAGVKTVVTVV